MSDQNLEQKDLSSPPPLDSLESIFNELDQEERQEQDIVTEGSLLAEVNSRLLVEREREYKDVEKHYVRINLWLPTATRIAKETQKVLRRNLRYLTLPAYYRIDVSLLLRKGLVEITDVDDNGRPKEVYVAAFEEDPTKYGRMVAHKPAFKLFGYTKIEKALVDSTNPYYHQLRDLFPFDVINFDLTTSLTPHHEGPYSETMRAIETVLELQAGHGTPWAFFLTFRNVPDDWQQGTIKQLFDNLQRNIDTYATFRDEFYKLYQRSSVAELAEFDIKRCISQSVAKWMVDRAHHYSFALNSLNCWYYTRYNQGIPPYDIYKHAFVFSRGEKDTSVIPAKGLTLQRWMEPNLVACLNRHKCLDVQKKICDVSITVPTIFDDISGDIDSLCAQVP